MHILLVEDSESEIELAIQVFDIVGIKAEIIIARDGQEAQDYLTDPNSIKPKLIFLDINMPRMNGLTLLQRLKTSDELKQIPVIMLTTSNAQSDISAAFKNHANAYIIKPYELSSFVEAMDRTKEFWLHTTELI